MSFVQRFKPLMIQVLKNKMRIFSECQKPQFRGDGICDDGNNIATCDFDGGDCCGPDVNTLYCNQCKCYNNIDIKEGK